MTYFSPNKCSVYFIINQGKNKETSCPLIYAKKGSEAGDFYNQKTINFIYKIVSSGTDIESFDPIEWVKSYFCEISETILENPIGKQELVYNVIRI